MGRPPRAAEGGLIYHALNRANARLAIFDDEGDYLAFERILAEAVALHPVRLLGYCLMPNDFHLLLWPHGDGDLSRFMRWLTLTHTQRWHAHRHSAGSGHLYQGATSRSRSRGMSTSTRSAATSSGTPCGPGWSRVRSAGGGTASGGRYKHRRPYPPSR